MKKFIHFPETPACPLTFTATSYQTHCWSFYLITTCWMANSETEESNGDKWSDNQQLNWFHRLQSIDSKFRCHPGTLQNSHSLAEQYSFCFLLQGALHSTIPAVVFLPWNTKQLPTISNMNLMLTVCLASVLLYTGNSLRYFHTHTHTHLYISTEMFSWSFPVLISCIQGFWRDFSYKSRSLGSSLSWMFICLFV